MKPFAAVLLAGGRSQRMGRDKALLRLEDGRRLWERQLAVLRELGPAELFISGPRRDGFPAEVSCLADTLPGRGPLAGIAAALRAATSPRVVVLAVDLPEMTAGFLRGLLGAQGGGKDEESGIVPQTADGFFEGLAAVYPRVGLAVAERQLEGNDRSLQTFVRELVRSGLVTARPVAVEEAGLFANWNRPEDLADPCVR